MSTTILTLEELQDARYSFEHLHEGIIDLLASLESDNWGCPVEETEAIRDTLANLADDGFDFLLNLGKYIEWWENR
jgi:hypothetical protein